MFIFMKVIIKFLGYSAISGTVVGLASHDIAVIIGGGLTIGTLALMVAKAISLNKEVKKAGIKMRYRTMLEEDVNLGDSIMLGGSSIKYEG